MSAEKITENQVAPWKAQLAVSPVCNHAADTEERGDGTIVLKIRKRRPAFLVPPLSWILRPRMIKRYELDRIGTRVWRLCNGNRTVGDIVDEFAAAHRLTFHEARVAVTDYISRLTRCGAIALVAAAEKTPNTDRKG